MSSLSASQTLPRSLFRHRTLLRLPALLLVGLSSSVVCAASPGDSEDKVAAEGGAGAVLAPVLVSALRHYDNAVGSSDAASQGSIQAALLKSRPAQRPGEVLEFVPGMMVTQHSGDGKANQYFLRGFNLDHGSDFATRVEGLPVNMTSHAHGQGYADLNFLIPELVERIDYRKGPYFANNGDLSTTGSADIHYVRRLDQPFAQLALGGHNYQRLVAAGSQTLGAQGPLALLGLEVAQNDGPWVVPERLRKHSLVASLSESASSQGWRLGLQSYAARWTATNQIPERLISQGSYQGRTFGRFDSLNDSDGGDTERLSLSAGWRQQGAEGSSELQAYVMRYRLSLWSDHTFAMERPEQGDQVLQQDRRTTTGLNLSRGLEHRIGPWAVHTEGGLQVRHDHISLGLYETEARQIRAITREDEVRQTSLGLWLQSGLELQPWLRAVLGLRADRVQFQVDSRHLAANSGSSHAQQLSPKLTLVFGPWARTEFFVNAGRGFHSNDARGTSAKLDPKSGEAVQAVPGLVANTGWELGARSEWWPGLQSSVALWALRMGSEQLYIGDSGTTEPRGPSRRHGLEWNNRWTPSPHWLVDADLAWSKARFVGVDAPFVPNAVDKIASLAVTARDIGPWSASLQWRYLGSSPLVEDNSQRSRASLTTNLRLSRCIGPAGRLGELTLDVFNLLDRKSNDIEYYYASQLPGEAQPVEDRHVHAAEPRALRLSWRLTF